MGTISETRNQPVLANETLSVAVLAPKHHILTIQGPVIFAINTTSCLDESVPGQEGLRKLRQQRRNCPRTSNFPQRRVPLLRPMPLMKLVIWPGIVQLELWVASTIRQKQRQNPVSQISERSASESKGLAGRAVVRRHEFQDHNSDPFQDQRYHVRHFRLRREAELWIIVKTLAFPLKLAGAAQQQETSTFMTNSMYTQSIQRCWKRYEQKDLMVRLILKNTEVPRLKCTTLSYTMRPMRRRHDTYDPAAGQGKEHDESRSNGWPDRKV